MNVNRVKRVPPLLIVALKPPGRYVQYEEAIHRCLQDLFHVKTHGTWIIHKQFIEINHPAIGLFFQIKITHGYPVDPWFSQLFTSRDLVTKNPAGQTGSWQKAAGRRGSLAAG